MTVSLALRNHPSIPESTCKRIQALCRKLGYTPDPMLSSLSVYRAAQRPPAYQSSLGWITQWPERNEPGTGASEFDLYFSAAVQQARTQGYSLEKIAMENIQFNTRRLEKILGARGVLGIVLPPAPWPQAELNIDYSRVSAVRIGFSYRHPHLHTVVNTQFHTAFHAVQETQNAGYRRIGIILSAEQDERTSWHFLGGYMAARNQMPREDRLEPFYPKRGSEDELHRWISRNRLDAVIGLGHAKLIKATGLSVGYVDLSVSATDKDLSGMCQNPEKLGQATIDLLTSMIHRGETGVPDHPLLVGVYSSWKPGKTLPRKIKT